MTTTDHPAWVHAPACTQADAAQADAAQDAQDADDQQAHSVLLIHGLGFPP